MEMKGKLVENTGRGSLLASRGENHSSTSHQTATFDQVLLIRVSVQIAYVMAELVLGLWKNDIQIQPEGQTRAKLLQT